MESVAFTLRQNIELLKEMGISVEEVRSIGGGARSRLWNQIKADVTRLPVVTLKVEEAASLGLAMLSGVSLKVFKSIEDACKTMVHFKERYSPKLENIPIYDRSYRLYIDVYEHLKGLF